MTDKNTGGAAFPCDRSEFFERNEGMTLRDYFAAKAMQGLFSAATSDDVASWLAEGSQEEGVPLPDYISRLSYRMADAMLEARQS